jgi:hypothetical protein
MAQNIRKTFNSIQITIFSGFTDFFYVMANRLKLPFYGLLERNSEDDWFQS